LPRKKGFDIDFPLAMLNNLIDAKTIDPETLIEKEGFTTNLSNNR
jgi:hypothetical protein